jgi:hypothetical protein
MGTVIYQRGISLNQKRKGIMPENTEFNESTNTNQKEDNTMSTTCNATKNNGESCTNNAKDNGFCGVKAHAIQGIVATEVAAPIIPEVITAPVNQKKEVTMKIIYQYLQAPLGVDVSDEDVAVRIITNCPSENALTAITRSAMLQGAPQQIEGSRQHVMAINSGNQEMPLLQRRAADKGVEFRIASFPVKTLEPDTILKMVTKANFAYSNSSRAVFVDFKGFDGWGLAPLGIEIQNTAKLVKRLNELLRQTAHFFYGDVNYGPFYTPEGDSDVSYDGMNIMSKEFAKKMNFKGTRGSFRLDVEEGVIKGDVIVVDHIPGGLDVLYHPENLKTEFATTGWTLATVADHAPLHQVAYDDQSRGNFNFFLNHETVKADLIRFVKENISKVEEGGELHNYLISMSEEPVVGQSNGLDTLSGTLHAQGAKLTEAGLPNATFANLTFTTLNALTRKMNASKIGKTDLYKKMFIPVSNAFVGAVLSYEIYTKMAGQVTLGESGGRTFFDQATGLVIPGDRFEKTFDLHGGWDHDDSVCVYAIKVYCSDMERAKVLHSTGVLDENLAFSSTPDRAVLAGLMIRRPNGPGEYSIEAISPDLPFHKFNMDTIPVIDLADAPLSQSEVFANTEMGQIPTSVNYDGDYDKEDAFSAICAQAVNPGVGTFANVLIAWSATFGSDNVPVHMVGKMEDVVDILEQTADEVSFSAISLAVEQMWVDFRDKVIFTGTTVEPSLLIGRVPMQLGYGDDLVLIGKAIQDMGLVTKNSEGPEGQLQALYAKAIRRLGNLARSTANSTRNDLDLAVHIRNMEFAPQQMSTVQDWYKVAYGRLSKLDREYRELDADAHAVARRHNQVGRKAAMESLMDQLVDMVCSLTNDNTDWFMLALYKFIVTPTEKFPNGNVDRVFTQPSTKGKPSMLDLFVDACRTIELIG